jgi:hypothetical protein
MNVQRTTRTRPARSNAPVVMCRARFALVTGVTWLLAGCPATGNEVRIPADQFYFPTGMAISPDQKVLFVASANSDLRFESGAIQVVKLEKVEALIEDWLATKQPPADLDCAADKMVRDTLVCDESEVILAAAGVRTGNFATELQIQTLASGNLRLFAAVRGDPSLTWIDYEVAEPNLTCSDTSNGFPQCDDDHRLVQLRNDEDLIALPDEPFGLFVDSAREYVVMTHLSTGAVSIADAPADDSGEPQAPVLSDAIGNLFAFDPQTGARGAVGVAGQPGDRNNRIYVTSRVESRVQTLVVVRGANGLPTLLPAEYFFLSRGVATSSNGRGIAFSADGARAYIVNRAPPMLHVIDTTPDALGVPNNQFIAGVELCTEASNLTVAETARGERVFVACFRNGQVWSIDPTGAVVDAIIEVGRGPHALVATADGERLYVSNNLEGTVAVVDLRPGLTQNQVVLRLGRPSPGETE